MEMDQQWFSVAVLKLSAVIDCGWVYLSTGDFKYDGRMAMIMGSDSRRGFLYRTVQVGSGAGLGVVAGCLSGGSGSKKSKPIKNVSFAGTEVRFELTENAVGKTINLIRKGSDESIGDRKISGGKTSIDFSLVKSTSKGTEPISSGEYLIRVVKDTEVVYERSITLNPNIKLADSGLFDKPNGSGKYLGFKLKNSGRLPARISYLGIPSGVPQPSKPPSASSTKGSDFSRVDSTSSNIQKIVQIGKIGTFSLGFNPFIMESEDQMFNHTVGNSSYESRKCDEKQRKATLAIKTSEGKTVRKPFKYALSGDMTSISGLTGSYYQCGNFSVTFPQNQSKENKSG